MGGFVPIPPSSAYCVQRSDSISSAAARNRRMATSPELREPVSCVFACARANVPLANSPAPTAALPARRLPFRKERRSTKLPEDFFFIFMLQSYCYEFVPTIALDALD